MILFRDAEGRSERLPGLAADLIRLKVDIIVASGTTASRAAKEATATIPIVMAPADDPVGMGLVVSLARPGELPREVVPNLVRVAVLWDPAIQAIARR